MVYRRKKNKAFTLVEVMIAVAVIAIGMLGAVAAIAFGLRASDRGSKGTFALTLNERILEMMCNAYPAPGPISTGGLLNSGAGKLYPDGDTLGVYDQANNSPLWHPIYGPGLAGQNTSPYVLQDFVPDSRVADQKTFADNAQLYQCNINVKYASAHAAPWAANDMALFTVSTRWRDKGYWRCITTMAYSSGTKS